MTILSQETSINIPTPDTKQRLTLTSIKGRRSPTSARTRVRSEGDRNNVENLTEKKKENTEIPRYTNVIRVDLLGHTRELTEGRS